MRAALALAALAALAAQARGASVTTMIAGDQLGGGVAVELPGAPLWRLDRAFQRTCVQIKCSGGKARAAARGAAMTRARRICAQPSPRRAEV